MAGKMRRCGRTSALGSLDWDTWSVLIIAVGLLRNHVSPVRRMAQGIQDSFVSRGWVLRQWIPDWARCGAAGSTRERGGCDG